MHPHAINQLNQNSGSSNKQLLKFVHIADPHFDSYYQEGSIADCGEPYCCRADTYIGKGSVQAGKFGMIPYSCDPPPITVEAVLNQIREAINPDVVIWTGDNSPHDSLQTNETEVINSTV